jgi:hypothetical protein
MTRTRDMMPIEPAALLRRMFHDLDPWREPRGELQGGESDIQERCARGHGSRSRGRGKNPLTRCRLKESPETKNVKVAS